MMESLNKSNFTPTLKFITSDLVSSGCVMVNRDKFRIGSADNCNFRIPRRSISKQHCTILRRNDQWFLENQCKKTRLNNKSLKLLEIPLLSNGDIINLNGLSFKFCLDDENERTSPNSELQSNINHTWSWSQTHEEIHDNTLPESDISNRIMINITSEESGIGTELEDSKELNKTSEQSTENVKGASLGSEENTDDSLQLEEDDDETELQRLKNDEESTVEFISFVCERTRHYNDKAEAEQEPLVSEIEKLDSERETLKAEYDELTKQAEIIEREKAESAEELRKCHEEVKMLKEAVEKKRQMVRQQSDMQRRNDLMKDLECSICSEIMIDPVMAECQHVFCSVCILQWLEQKAQCVLCRKPIKFLDMVPLFDETIDQLMKCVQSDEYEAHSARRQERLSTWSDQLKYLRLGDGAVAGLPQMFRGRARGGRARRRGSRRS